MVARAASQVWQFALSLPVIGSLLSKVQDSLGSADDQNFVSFLTVMRQYRKFDFAPFLKSHREALQKGMETGDYVAGVCNYYKVMADLITVASGPFWHFVPMTIGMSRKECHDKFHHTMSTFLDAKKGDEILEIGCGFGEIGRQIAKISGASMTGLTMADEEIVGANERIKLAGLEKQCSVVQGNYHKLPFEANTFDKVFGVYTLKYSADLNTAISEAARVLKPGGRFVSYEIIVTDKYDSENKEHRFFVQKISDSTCMPPLWPATAFREAASKAGLKLKEEVDLCAAPGEAQWYSCFEKTGMHSMLMSNLVLRLVGLAEAIGILPRAFTEFYAEFLVHPTTDFVNAGRLGIVAGSVMMVWEKS